MLVPRTRHQLVWRYFREHRQIEQGELRRKIFRRYLKDNAVVAIDAVQRATGRQTVRFALPILQSARAARSEIKTDTLAKRPVQEE